MLIASCFVLSSCLDCRHQNIVGDFYIWSTNGLEEEQCLRRESEDKSYDLVDRMIFAYWYNDNYIIVKQHPRINEYEGEVDKNITNYLIVKIGFERDSLGYYNDSVIGPLEEKELDTKVKELEITEDIQFQNVQTHVAL